MTRRKQSIGELHTPAAGSVSRPAALVPPHQGIKHRIPPPRERHAPSSRSDVLKLFPLCFASWKHFGGTKEKWQVFDYGNGFWRVKHRDGQGEGRRKLQQLAPDLKKSKATTAGKQRIGCKRIRG